MTTLQSVVTANAWYLYHVGVSNRHEPTTVQLYQKGQSDILVYFTHLGFLPVSHFPSWKLVQEGGETW